MYTLTTITDSSVVRAPDNEFDFGGATTRKDLDPNNNVLRIT